MSTVSEFSAGQINPRNNGTADVVKEFAAPGISSFSWYCPFCRTGSPKAPERCQECQAVLSLAQVDSLLNNDKVKRQVVSEALARLENQVRSRPDFHIYLYLGLGHVNLQQFDQAQKFLLAAQRQRPADPTLRSQISALMRKRESLEIAAKIESSRKVRIQPPTVLVADNSSKVRDLVVAALEPEGYRIVQASEGHEAIELMRRGGAPELILADATLRGLDGYQLCKLIRQHPETRHIPVVLLSEKEGFFDKIREYKAGITFTLAKPFTARELASVAAGFVKK